MGMVATADVPRLRERHLVDSLRAATVGPRPTGRHTTWAPAPDSRDRGRHRVPRTCVMTLVESRRPRAAFLQLVLGRLELSNGTVSNVRVRDARGPGGPVLLPGVRSGRGRVGARGPAPRPRGQARLLGRRALRSCRTARRGGVRRWSDVCACKVGTARYHEPAVTTSGAKAAPRTTRHPRRPRVAPPPRPRAGNARRRTRSPRDARCGSHHRHREPEGRRREVDHGGEPGGRRSPTWDTASW